MGLVGHLLCDKGGRCNYDYVFAMVQEYAAALSLLEEEKQEAMRQRTGTSCLRRWAAFSLHTLGQADVTRISSIEPESDWVLKVR